MADKTSYIKIGGAWFVSRYQITEYTRSGAAKWQLIHGSTRPATDEEVRVLEGG